MDRMAIDVGPGVPIYVKIANDMRQTVKRGQWPVGYQLPGLHALAREYNCSWGTIRSAQQVLVEEGLLSPVRIGVPTSVVAQPSEPTISEVLSRLRDMRQTIDELIVAVQGEVTKRRQVQASHILIQQERRHPVQRDRQHKIIVQVTNASDQPVYDVKIKWHRGSAPWGEPSIEERGALPPQNLISSEREFPTDTDFEVSGAVVTFRDAAGITWLRRPDGELMGWPD